MRVSLSTASFLSMLFLTMLLGSHLPASGPSGSAAEEPDAYAAIVLADAPLAYWRFSGEQPGAGDLRPGRDRAALPGEFIGSIAHEVEGPRPAEFPLFDSGNTGIRISGVGYLRVSERAESEELRFTLGDSITLEAWVRPSSIPNGGYVYLVGKGRTQRAGFDPNNQNYALRLAGGDGTAGVAFLFRSAGPEPQWHRWTSERALVLDGGWHHVAVSYTFGQRGSVRGYIDGEAVPGQWDMDGATDRPPVADGDDVWIGSSMGGSPGNTYQGELDEVAIYRAVLPPERIAARYRYVAAETELDLSQLPDGAFLVELCEGIPDRTAWSSRRPPTTETYTTEVLAFTDVRHKYSARGLKEDRSSPFLLRVTGYATLPEGPQRILLRCRNGARLSMDGRQIAQTPFHNIPASGHGQVHELDAGLAPNIRPLRRGDSQAVVEVHGDGGRHLFQLEMIVGGRRLRPELGETSVSIGPPEGDFRLLTAGESAAFPLTDRGWTEFVTYEQRQLAVLNAQRRREVGAEETAYWEWRHELARGVIASRPRPAVPSEAAGATGGNAIDRFLEAALAAAGESPAALADDLSFLRRVALDVTGVIPTEEQVREFLSDDRPDRRARWIDRLLASDGWADGWTGYWQDVLAENPNIVNPTLNNTGPFRWWIHESLLDNKPFDRWVTELVMMEGSTYFGGPAGFALATQNDAPMAAKAHILGQAFLALEMKCARCHDAPYHEFRQRDLFSLAAMLRRGPQEVPATSSVPGSEEALSSLLIEITLKPGEKVPPAWSFTELVPDELPEGVLRQSGDSRERLAALITAPHNRRFAQVIVNRLWQRYLGRGLVEPADDWEHTAPSHPELLDYLADELVIHGYDLKHVARLILNSHAYQRVARSAASVPGDRRYLFAAPIQRRMSAEQLVDSLFLAAGKPFDAGRMSIDIDGARPADTSLDLGVPSRAWQFASLSNERDRPSLALPHVEPFVALMEVFGWRSSRQDPLTVRDTDPTVQQPAMLANGTLSARITRLSDDSSLTELALQDQPLEELIDRIYLRLLTRPPNEAERDVFRELLAAGYAQRLVAAPLVEKPWGMRDTVSWSNHLHPRANVIKTELEAAVRRGDPPTARLVPDWRERLEDMVWTLVNSPEFVFVP